MTDIESRYQSNGFVTSSNINLGTDVGTSECGNQGPENDRHRVEISIKWFRDIIKHQPRLPTEVRNFLKRQHQRQPGGLTQSTGTGPASLTIKNAIYQGKIEYTGQNTKLITIPGV